MWQVFFADWLARHKNHSPHDKLNVAQAAKEAGVEYKNLSAEQREVRVPDSSTTALPTQMTLMMLTVSRLGSQPSCSIGKGGSRTPFTCLAEDTYAGRHQARKQISRGSAQGWSLATS